MVTGTIPYKTADKEEFLIYPYKVTPLLGSGQSGPLLKVLKGNGWDSLDRISYS